MIEKRIKKNIRNKNFFVGRINSIEYFNYRNGNINTRAARLIVIENMRNPQSMSFVIFGGLMNSLLQVRSGDMLKIFYRTYAKKSENGFYNLIVAKSFFKV